MQQNPPSALFIAAFDFRGESKQQWICWRGINQNKGAEKQRKWKCKLREREFTLCWVCRTCSTPWGSEFSLSKVGITSVIWSNWQTHTQKKKKKKKWSLMAGCWLTKYRKMLKIVWDLILKIKNKSQYWSLHPRTHFLTSHSKDEKCKPAWLQMRKHGKRTLCGRKRDGLQSKEEFIPCRHEIVPQIALYRCGK